MHGATAAEIMRGVIDGNRPKRWEKNLKNHHDVRFLYVLVLFLYVLVRFLYPFTRGWHNFAAEKKYVRMNIVCFQLLVIINF